MLNFWYINVMFVSFIFIAFVLNLLIKNFFFFLLCINWLFDVMMFFLSVICCLLVIFLVRVFKFLFVLIKIAFFGMNFKGWLNAFKFMLCWINWVVINKLLIFKFLIKFLVILLKSIFWMLNVKIMFVVVKVECILLILL